MIEWFVNPDRTLRFVETKSEERPPEPEKDRPVDRVFQSDYKGARMNAVEIKNVTKCFGPLVAVHDLSLSVPQGSVYGFIGPNGSGKTTTLRMIMNIIYPDDGSIRIFGRKLWGTSTDRIGYLPEERGLYKRMKVRELLRFYGSLKNGKNVKRQVDYWLEALGLADKAKLRVEALSKGMAQKIQFIATVVSEPDLIILDEPFTGLDPVNASVIRKAILDLQKRGATIIFSTHDMSVAEEMCDFIFMIFKGKKVLDGTLDTIQSRYGSDVLRIAVDNGQSVLDRIRGVAKVTDLGQIQELRMSDTRDPQEILKEIMSHTRVHKFEIAKPSLHDIFVRIAGTEAGETTDEENSQDR
jgi:ABC-2 type transport system ATP-binding protein